VASGPGGATLLYQWLAGIVSGDSSRFAPDVDCAGQKGCAITGEEGDVEDGGGRFKFDIAALKEVEANAVLLAAGRMNTKRDGASPLALE
jgi:hypothetical protein